MAASGERVAKLAQRGAVSEDRTMQHKPADSHPETQHPETLLGVNTDLFELFQPFVNMGPVR